MLKDMNDEPRTDLTDRESDTSASVTYSHDTEQACHVILRHVYRSSLLLVQSGLRSCRLQKIKYKNIAPLCQPEFRDILEDNRRSYLLWKAVTSRKSGRPTISIPQTARLQFITFPSSISLPTPFPSTKAAMTAAQVYSGEPLRPNAYDSDGPLFDYHPPRPQFRDDPRLSSSHSSTGSNRQLHQPSMDNFDTRSHSSQHDSRNSRGTTRSMNNLNGAQGTPPTAYPDELGQTRYEAQPPPMGPRGRQLPPTQPSYSDEDRDVSPSPPGDDDDFFTQQAPFDAAYAQSLGRESQRGPSPPPQPLLDHSHLRPGNQASLLSHEKTLELYRANAKKTQDPEVQFEFAVFMIDASKSMPIPVETPGNVIEVERAIEKRDNLIREAIALLKKLADRGHAASQYFLADCYANGIGTKRGRQDFDSAYPLFVLAAKHGHPDASYRAGTCCENGWGCRRESAKAVQFFRKAAASLHPGAMYRLGIAELNGELGLSKSPKEGVKWLKRSAEHATAEFPHALHELALLHERGIHNVVFVDYEYAAELLAQAAELGYAPSAYRLGECYEYGKMGCPQDAALSIHYYVSYSFLA